MNTNTAGVFAFIRVAIRGHPRYQGVARFPHGSPWFENEVGYGRDPFWKPLAACDAPVAPLPSTSGLDRATSRLFTLELRQG
jgi:hypothetical protein